MKKFVLILLPFFLFISGTKAEDNIPAIEKIVYQWNDIHNAGIVSEFRNLYNYTVLFYGKSMSREQCLNKKRASLQDQFRQKIISPIKISYYPSGTIKCFFTIEVNIKETLKKYPAYLLLEKRRNNYVITGESNLVSDQNEHFQLNLGPEIRPTPTNRTAFITALAAVVLMSTGYLVFRKRKNIKIPRMKVRRMKVRRMKVRRMKVPSMKIPSVKTPATKTRAIPIPELPVQEKKVERSPFEKFVAERFDQSNFEILEWQNEKSSEGLYAKYNRHPDLEIRLKHENHNIVFAVECKWQKIFYSDKILWAKPHQWDNYNAFEHTTGNPVFVVIGMGDDPASPENVFILPLKQINSTQFTISQLEQYKKPGKDNFFFDVENRTLR